MTYLRAVHSGNKLCCCGGVTEADHDGVRGHGGESSVTEMKIFHKRSVKVP